MPGGKKHVTFLDESWDYPEPIIPPVVAATRGKEPGISGSSGQESGSERTLEERW